MRITASGQTDVGRQRDHNEDVCLIDPDLGLYIVCDGMGGHAAGEIASQETVRLVQASIRRQRAVLSDYINSPTFEQRTQVLRLVEGAVQEACAHIYAMGQNDPMKKGMGTPHWRWRDSVQSGRFAIMPCSRAWPQSGKKRVASTARKAVARSGSAGFLPW